MSETTTGSKKEQLLQEFNAIVSETERLLKSVNAPAGSTDAEAAAAFDAKVDENLKAARERLEHLEDAFLQRAKAAVKSTDTFVREHPWQAMGIAAGIGILIGLLLKRR
jgi:ElaB/YqjD/DUF883 family membrane-anchored ribosome-binding protein